MIKKEIRPEDITMNIGTMPLALISTYGDEKRGFRPNACAAGYIGSIDSKHIAVALRPSRFTYKQARETGAFGINFLSFDYEQISDLANAYNVFSEKLKTRVASGLLEHAKGDSRKAIHPSLGLESIPEELKAALYLATAADYCGSFSGRIDDKFEKTGLTAERAYDINVPLIPQCAARVACELVECIESPGRKGGRHDLLIGKIVEEHLPKGQTFFITASNYNYRLAGCGDIENVAEDFPRSPFLVTTPDGNVHRNSRFGVVCEQGEQTVFLAYDKNDDSAEFIRKQKEFTVNVPPYMVENNFKVSFMKGKKPISEAGFTSQLSMSVSAPSILECRTSLECVVKEEKELGNTQIFIAQIKKCLADGMIDYCTDLSMDIGGEIHNNEYVIGRMSAIYNIERKEREHLEKIRTGGN